MKIDLHLHSKASSFNGDSIKWIGDKEVLALLYKYNYKMISFTDHNVLDYKQYIKFRKYLNGAISILPGIEVNIITERGEIGNILFLFKEDLNEEELERISHICEVKLKKNGVTHKQAMECFGDYETIIIPHVGKSDYLAPSDLAKINYDAFEATNLKHHNYVKSMKWIDNEVSTVAFSDTHVWTSYPQQDKLITDIELEEPTFNLLKEKLKERKDFTVNKYGK